MSNRIKCVLFSIPSVALTALAILLGQGEELPLKALMWSMAGLAATDMLRHLWCALVDPERGLKESITDHIALAVVGVIMTTNAVVLITLSYLLVQVPMHYAWHLLIIAGVCVLAALAGLGSLLVLTASKQIIKYIKGGTNTDISEKHVQEDPAIPEGTACCEGGCQCHKTDTTHSECACAKDCCKSTKACDN